MSTPNLVPAFSPDGKSVFVTTPEGRAAMIPTDNLGDALQNHDFQLGVPQDVYTKYLSQRQAIPGVHVTTPEGRDAVLPSTQVHEAMTEHGFKLGPANQQNLGQPEQPGLLSRAWESQNKPLISGKDLLNYQKAPNQPTAPVDPGLAMAGITPAPKPDTDYYQKLKDYVPSVSLAESDHPILTGIKHGLAGAATDTADMLSSFTSPLSLELVGAGALSPEAEAGSKLYKAIKIGQAGAGIGMGVQGVQQIHHAATDTSQPLPERLQEGLQGAAMLSGGVAGAGEAGVGRTAMELGGKTTDLALRGKQALQNTSLRNNPITNTLIGPKPEAISAEDAFSKATKPRNSIKNINRHVQNGLPDAVRSANDLGINIDTLTLPDAEKAVVQAKKDVFGELEGNVLGPNSQYQVGTTPVADKISAVEDGMTSIQKRRMPGIVNKIRQSAADYADKTYTFGDIEDRIQELNNQLRSQQSQYKVNEQALRNDPKYAYQFAELDGLRALERTAFEDLTGQAGGGAYIRDLKNRYGSLKVLQDVIDRRIPVVERQNPAKLYETLGRMSGLGDITTGVLAREPSKIVSGAVKIRAGKNAQMLNDPNFLIQQAFKKTAPRPPAVISPVRPPIAGLLNPGPIELPSSQEPINPGPEGVLPAARTTVIDPRTGQPRTQFLTSVAEPKSPIQKLFAGTAAGAANDTALFQQARQQLGPNASISDVALLAQKLKAQSAQPKITVAPPSNNSPYDMRSLMQGERRSTPRESGVPAWSQAERTVRQAGFDTLPGGQGVNKELGTITFWDKSNPNGQVAMPIADVEQGGVDAVKAKMADRMGQQEAKAGKAKRQPIDTSKKTVELPQGEAVAGNYGADTQVKTPGGSVPAKYKLVEADSLIPSHNAHSFAKNPQYPEGVQERAYHTSKEAQNRVIQQAQNYEPAYTVNTNPDAVNGPPVVTPDGIVLGGNSRTMSTQRLYKAGQGQAYKDFLKQNAGQFGIQPEHIDQMHNPVLVREIPKPENVEEARRIGADLNKSMTGALGVSERAVSAGRSVKPETLASISGMVDDLGEGGTMRAAMAKNGKEITDMLVRDGVITERERPQFIDTTTGGLSEEGKTFVERALVGSVVDDPRLMDTVPKSVLNKMEGSLGDLASVGARTDEYNLLPLVREALAEHVEMARSGMSVDNYLRQNTMFGPARNPAVDTLVRALAGGTKDFRAAVKSFAQDAKFDVQNQGTLAGLLGQQPSSVDAFNHAFGTNLTEDQFHDSLLQSLEKEGKINGNAARGQAPENPAADEGVRPAPKTPAPKSPRSGNPKTQSGAATPEPSSPVADLLAGKQGTISGVPAEKGAGPSPSATPQNEPPPITSEQRKILEFHATRMENNGAHFDNHDEVARQLLGVPESMTHYWNSLPEQNKAKVIREFLKSGKPFGEWTESQLKAGERFSITPTSRPQSGGTSPIQDLLAGKSQEQGKTVTVNIKGQNRSVQLTPEQSAAWDAAEQEHQKKVNFYQRQFSIDGDSNLLQKNLKGEGMRYAAEKRRIAGELTSKEQSNADAKQASNYQGKSVTVNGKSGTVTGTAFGKIRVKLESGETISANPEDVQANPQKTLGAKPKGFSKKGQRSGEAGFAKMDIAQTLTEPFKKWFGESKVTDEQGKPIVLYRGDYRGDKLGPSFKINQTTSGRFYFTDDPAIASSYSQNKPDLKNVEEHYGQNFTFPDLKYPRERNAPTLDQAWYRLTPEQKARVQHVVETTTMDDQGNLVFDAGHSIYPNDDLPRKLRLEHHGNWLKVAQDIWLDSGTLFDRERDFEKIMQHAGLNADYDSAHLPRSTVTPVFLSIKNPLNTAAIPTEVIAKLDELAKADRSRPKNYGVDIWDKGTITPRQWVQALHEDLDNGTTHAWTRVPEKITQALESMGYDGIKDTGGKMGGTGHNVWIAFHPTQIKSAIGNKGTFNPNDPKIINDAKPSGTDLSPLAKMFQGMSA